jgi:membrane fusion protein (multidrug efflux system)
VAATALATASGDADMALTPYLARLRFVSRFVLLIVVPLVVVAVGLAIYARGGRHMETDNAYVKANIVAVSADVAGPVIEVGVRDHEQVDVGRLLFRVDPAPFQVEVERAEAQMAVVKTEIDSLRADYRVAMAEAKEVEARIRFLRRQVERQAQLKERGMTREEQYDEARLNLEAARQRLDAVSERAARIVASLSGDVGRPLEQHPSYQQAKAARDAAQLDLARTRVVAPSAGVVSNMKLQAGEHVSKGVPVFSLIENGPLWVEANFKETQLTYMHEGQAATIVADAYPDHEWRAKVRTISPATGAEFAVLPPQNATGNWVKIVQRVPVQLGIELAPGDPPLRAGMTVTVRVDTGRARGLPDLVQRLLDNGAVPGFVREWLRGPRAAHHAAR